MNTRVQIASTFLVGVATLGLAMPLSALAVTTSLTRATVSPSPTPTATPVPLERKRELLHETIQARQTELETKLSARNQEMGKRIETKINERNKAFVIVLTRAADRLTAILSKMEARLAILKQGKIDTSAADAAVVNAHTALTAFTTALGTQRQKEYTVDLVSTDNVREALQTTLTEFKTDHQLLRQQTLANVHQAFKAVLEQLRALTKATSLKEVSPSSLPTRLP